MLRICLLIGILLCNFVYGATQQEASDKRDIANTTLQMSGENKTTAFTQLYDVLWYAALVESDINNGNWSSSDDKNEALAHLDNIVGYLTECWLLDYEYASTILTGAQTSYNDSTTEYNAEDWTGAYIFACDVIAPANSSSNTFANLYILAYQKNGDLYDLWLTIPW